MHKAVFLDRDGTINVDPGYLNRPEQMNLLPGAGEALARLKRAGFLLVVVSNQSGVGRGLIRRADMEAIHARLDELLGEFGVAIDRYELCFHHPDEDCVCRKPRPTLLLAAARELQIDLSASYMVGDKLTDLGAGQAAGCRESILVRTGAGAHEENSLSPGQGIRVVNDLAEAARYIQD